MKTSQSFTFYPSDFLLGTSLMSAAEVGAYIRLLCYQWQEGALPNDEQKLARLAQADLETIRGVVGKFSATRDGRLRNKKMESVRKSLNAYKKSRSENGKKGGRPKKHVVSQCFPDAEHTESLPSPSPSPSPSPFPSPPPSPKEREAISREPAVSLAEVKTWASSVMASGECAETFWNEMEGCGWVDHKGRPVVKARSAFQAYAIRWKGNDARNASRKNASPTAFQPKPEGLFGHLLDKYRNPGMQPVGPRASDLDDEDDVKPF